MTVAATVAPSAFAADATERAGTPNARFTGPLVTGGPAHPEGLFSIEPYLIYNHVDHAYDADGKRRSLADPSHGWHLSVPMMYGMTERVTLAATLNAFHGESPLGERTTRAGDAQVGVMYELLRDSPSRRALTVMLRQNLPVGHHDRMDLEPHELTTGSGAATTRLSLHGQMYGVVGGRTLRTRGNLKYTLPYDGAAIHGESVYGTPAAFEGSADLRGGWEASIGLEYALDSRWVLALDGVFERDFGSRVHGVVPGASGLVPVDFEHDASRRFSIAPAVEFHVNDMVGVIAGAFVSLDGRNSAGVVAPQVAVNVAF